MTFHHSSPSSPRARFPLYSPTAPPHSFVSPRARPTPQSDSPSPNHRSFSPITFREVYESYHAGPRTYDLEYFRQSEKAPSYLQGMQEEGDESDQPLSSEADEVEDFPSTILGDSIPRWSFRRSSITILQYIGTCFHQAYANILHLVTAVSYFIGKILGPLASFLLTPLCMVLIVAAIVQASRYLPPYLLSLAEEKMRSKSAREWVSIALNFMGISFFGFGRAPTNTSVDFGMTADELNTQPLNFKVLDSTVEATNRLVRLSIDILPISSMLRFTPRSLSTARDIVDSSSILSQKDELGKGFAKLEDSAKRLQVIMNKYDIAIANLIQNFQMQLEYAIKRIKRHKASYRPPISIARLVNPVAILGIFICAALGIIHRKNRQKSRFLIAALAVAILAWLSSDCCLHTSSTEIPWCPPIRAIFSSHSPMYAARKASQQKREYQSLDILDNFIKVSQGLEYDLQIIHELAFLGLETSDIVSRDFSAVNHIRLSNKEIVKREIKFLEGKLRNPPPDAGFILRMFTNSAMKKHNEITLGELRTALADLSLADTTLDVLDHAHQDAHLIFDTAISVLNEMIETQRRLIRGVDRNKRFVMRSDVTATIKVGEEADWDSMLFELESMAPLVGKLEEQGMYQSGERERWNALYRSRYFACTEEVREKDAKLGWGNGGSWEECFFGGSKKAEEARAI